MHDQSTPDNTSDLERQEALPHLDEALQTLKERDRTAVAIRYLQDRPLADVAEALGVSTEAAQKVASRALIKLQSRFNARGTVLSIDALALALAAQAATDSPAAFLADLARLPTDPSHASAVPPISASAATGAAHMMLLAKLQTACVSVLVALATIAAGAVLVQQTRATSQPTTSAAVPAVADASEGVIHVRAFIDGRSFLTVRGNTVQWNHLEFAAPGRLGGQHRPTVINGKDWQPEWPDLAEENREYRGVSSKYEGLVPPLPPAAVEVSVVAVQVRGKVTVTQQPTADNQYATIIDFDDGPIGGAANYVVDIHWRKPGAATQSTTGR